MLPVACGITLLAWTSDCLDGPLVRRSPVPYRSWVGDNDLLFDVAFALGLLVYMLLAGFVDLWLGGVYILTWSLIFGRFRLLSALGKLFQAPIYGWFLIVSLREAPVAGGGLVAWILAVLVFTWPKFPKEIIPSFLAGMVEVRKRVKGIKT